MARNRKTAIALVMLMALFVPTPQVKAESREPEITLQGTTLRNDKEYFEVSLKIDAGEVEYAAAGVALEYRSDIIEPVQWDSEGTRIDMSETRDWQHVSSIPALSPSELIGKTALGYEVEEKKGYMYLSSEASKPITRLSEAKEKTATVRFRYVGEDASKREENKAKVIEGYEREEIIKLAPRTIAEESPVGYMAYYAGRSDEYYYNTETTPSATPETTPDATPSASPEVTEEPTPEPTPQVIGRETTPEAEPSPEVTEAPTAEPTPDASPEETVEPTTEPSEAPSKPTPKPIKELKSAPRFVLEQDGNSANTGGVIDASKFVAIVFYDWDESTMLGSITAPKGADASGDVAAFEKTLKDDSERATLYSDDKSKPLTNKKGYSFEGVWLDFNSETRTHYGATTDSNVTIEKPASISFENLTGSIVVKAAYGSNEELATTGAARYTAEIVGYNRFAATPNYSVKIRVRRETTMTETGEDGVAREVTKGVPRASEPGIRVTMTTTTGVQLYSLVTLENKDDVIFEVVPNDSIKNFKYSVIDMYGKSNWISGAPLRTVDSTENQGTPAEKSGFRYLGSLRGINESVEPGGVLNNITNAILTNSLGIDIKKPTGSGNVSLANLKKYIQSAWQLKNPGYEDENHPEFIDLTWDEIQYAIKNEGSLKPS